MTVQNYFTPYRKESTMQEIKTRQLVRYTGKKEIGEVSEVTYLPNVEKGEILEITDQVGNLVNIAKVIAVSEKSAIIKMVA
jgi:hypothetical protein